MLLACSTSQWHHKSCVGYNVPDGIVTSLEMCNFPSNCEEELLMIFVRIVNVFFKIPRLPEGVLRIDLIDSFDLFCGYHNSFYEKDLHS